MARTRGLFRRLTVVAALLLASAAIVPHGNAQEPAATAAITHAESALPTAAPAPPVASGNARKADIPSELARMENAVLRYRRAVQRGGWPELPEGKILRPGMVDPRVLVLRRIVRATGDLRDRTESEEYDPKVVEAVRRFQYRHGLFPDGRVGKKTRLAMNVPVEARLAQIELNLERLRRLPVPEGVYIRVNVPAAMLDVIEGERRLMRMPVVVGTVVNATPEFYGQITAMTFNPTWTMPRSVATEEILPLLQQDPNYLAANNMTIVDRPEDPHGHTIDWQSVTPDRFPYWFRQAAGPRNPLGRIRFDIPNTPEIYLHDTPSPGLFDLSVRTFSRGCIRLSRPRELAALLLRSDPRWDAAAIEAAIATGATRRVRVPEPMPLLIAYLTAFVEPDGAVHFREDIYGRDLPPLESVVPPVEVPTSANVPSRAGG